MGLLPAAAGGVELASALASALIVGHNTILFLVGVTVLLGIGVLIGSSLHTRSIDQKYRRLAQYVRQLNEQETALDARGHPGDLR